MCIERNQGRSYLRAIPSIAHQRLVRVSEPAAYVNARSSMYETADSVYRPVSSYYRYQPAYTNIEDSFTSSLQVSVRAEAFPLSNSIAMLSYAVFTCVAVWQQRYDGISTLMAFKRVK